MCANNIFLYNVTYNSYDIDHRNIEKYINQQYLLKYIVYYTFGKKNGDYFSNYSLNDNTFLKGKLLRSIKSMRQQFLKETMFKLINDIIVNNKHIKDHKEKFTRDNIKNITLYKFIDVHNIIWQHTLNQSIDYIDFSCNYNSNCDYIYESSPDNIDFIPFIDDNNECKRLLEYDLMALTIIIYIQLIDDSKYIFINSFYSNIMSYIKNKFNDTQNIDDLIVEYNYYIQDDDLKLGKYLEYDINNISKKDNNIFYI